MSKKIDMSKKGVYLYYIITDTNRTDKTMTLVDLKIQTSKSSYQLSHKVLCYMSGEFYATCQLVDGVLNADDLIKGIESFALTSTKKTYPAMCKTLVNKIKKAVADYNLELQAKAIEEAQAIEEAKVDCSAVKALWSSFGLTLPSN